MSLSFKGASRVVTTGDSSVGKTSIIASLTGSSFNAHEPATIGANWRLYSEMVNGVSVQMQIWDTAGQERYRSLGPLYFRDAVAAIVVFDITAQESWESVSEWVTSILGVAGNEVVIFIVGNKVDIRERRAVPEELARTWAEERKYEYFETSAQTGEGIHSLFATVALKISARRSAPTDLNLQPNNSSCC
jgi:small GTP-binding protein